MSIDLKQKSSSEGGKIETHAVIVIINLIHYCIYGDDCLEAVAPLTSMNSSLPTTWQCDEGLGIGMWLLQADTLKLYVKTAEE